MAVVPVQTAFVSEYRPVAPGFASSISTDVVANVPLQAFPNFRKAPISLVGYERDVAAGNAFCGALQSEIEKKESAVAQLHSQIRDVELDLHDATRGVQMVSKGVVDTALAHGSVLAASSMHLDHEHGTLLAQLSKMDNDLVAKDAEIQRLRQELMSLDSFAAQQTSQIHNLRRNQAIGDVQINEVARKTDDLERQIRAVAHRERLESELRVQNTTKQVRHQLQQQEDIRFEMECDTDALRAYIMDAENECQWLVNTLKHRQDELARLEDEARANTCQAHLSQVILQGQVESSRPVERGLRYQIECEQGIGGPYVQKSQIPQPVLQQESLALAKCTEAMAKELDTPSQLQGTGASADEVDKRMYIFQNEVRRAGEQSLPVARLGPGVYLVGDQQVNCSVINDRLMVAGPNGWIPLSDFLKGKVPNAGTRGLTPNSFGSMSPVQPVYNV